MGYFPTDETTLEDAPVCPNCGYQWDNDYETVSYDDGGTVELECPDCDLTLECVTTVTYAFSIVHPSKCVVRGYHSPYVNITDNPITNKHECLYCEQPLTCDCTLHDHCTHNLIVEASNEKA